MRLCLRLQTVLVVVAVSSVPLAYAAETFRTGRFAFQRYFAARERFYRREASEAGGEIQIYQYHDHGGPGNYCAWCRVQRSYKDPTGRKTAEARRRRDEARRRARWHDFLAGPDRDRPPEAG